MLTTEEFKKHIEILSNGKYLSYDEGKSAFEYIMTGNATDILISSFLTSLKIIFINSGISHDLIAAGADIMREKAIKIKASDDTIDIVGTGGDGHNTLNISTATALVISGTGIKVAKHGNYSASSMSGSADVLISLGINIKNDISNVQKCLDECGICFLFAPKHHSAMKHVVGPRKEIGQKSIFNVLGPLTNPAGAKKQVMGVYDKRWMLPIAEVLRELGSEHLLIIHSEDGLDEISIASKTYVTEMRENKISEYVICPEDFGFETTSLDELIVNSPEESLEIAKSALKGEHKTAGAMVSMTAGAALYVSGISGNLEDGINLAKDCVAEGRGMTKLNQLVEFSSQF